MTPILDGDTVIFKHEYTNKILISSTLYKSPASHLQEVATTDKIDEVMLIYWTINLHKNNDSVLLSNK